MFILRLLFALSLAGPIAAETVSGRIRVIDADTIDIGAPANVRLISIDAPETGQTCRDGGRTLDCGAAATAAAERMLAGRWADCTVEEVDRYGRLLAVCHVAGVDVNAALVRAGWALRYRDDPRYEAEEKAAAVEGLGTWAYEMADPSDWRAARRAARAEANAPEGACAIKGNISGNGRLYHLPGMRSYGPTRIDESRGERWFCTEAEAVASGWRRAGGI